MTQQAAWTLPTEAQGQVKGDVVTTGPSGLMLGQGATGPVTIRLFRPAPTRLLVAVPEYVTWLLAFRSISLGAHLSIVAENRRRWQGLADAVQRCGGTADFIGGQHTVIPGQGRPYRPSLIIDDASFMDGSQITLGSWQAVMMIEDASASGAVHLLRSCDMALISPADTKTLENLRRAYVLSQRQLRLAQNLESNEVVLAMPRRLGRLAVPPTPTEYGLLFGRGR